MTDAMDRLVRGAVKLEPEILDELGNGSFETKPMKSTQQHLVKLQET